MFFCIFIGGKNNTSGEFSVSGMLRVVNTTATLLSPDEANKFLAGGDPFKSASKIGSCGCRILFLNAPHLHAKVLCLNNNGNSKRVERMLNAIFYLCG